MPARLRRFLPLIAIAAGIALFFASGLYRHVSLEGLREQRAALDDFVTRHYAAAMAAFFIFFVAAIACSLPLAFVLSVAGGFLFGALAATPVIVLAATIGSTIVFLIVKHALGEWLHERTRGWLARFEDGFRANAFNYIVALRLTPVAPLFIVNVVAGLLDVKTRDFALATLIGLVPWSFIFASAGHGLRGAFNAGVDPDPAAAARAIIFSPEIALAIGVLIVIALAPVIAKRLRRS